jgi:probable HAF family extracellular repeat protein
MQKTLVCASLACLLAEAAIGAGPSLRYSLTDLGPLGPGGSVVHINQLGLVSGALTAADVTDHASVWFGKHVIDISKPGLGGANSIAYASNIFGQVGGGAETGTSDPNAADFCGFKAYGLVTSGKVCAPFVWWNGVMRAMPTLGGYNGSVTQINTFGVATGEAENGQHDPGCPQRLQFKPVKWQNGKVIELPTYPGDADALAYAINDLGQVAGSSGECAPFNPNLQAAMLPLHPLRWEPDGSVTYLGTLGGTGRGFANLAINMNNKGHVVGTSALAGDQVNHAFLWTKQGGMRDLGALNPTDVNSGAAGINDLDEITGISVPADGPPSAFVWRNGQMTDLNTVVRGAGSLHLLAGVSINNSGVILGIAIDTQTGEVHGFLAAPAANGFFNGQGAEPDVQNDAKSSFSPEAFRKLLESGLLAGRLRAPVTQ